MQHGKKSCFPCIYRPWVSLVANCTATSLQCHSLWSHNSTRDRCEHFHASYSRPAPADPQQRRPQEGVAAVLSMHAVPQPRRKYTGLLIIRFMTYEAQGSSLSSQHLTYAPGTRVLEPELT